VWEFAGCSKFGLLLPCAVDPNQPFILAFASFLNMTTYVSFYCPENDETKVVNFLKDCNGVCRTEEWVNLTDYSTRFNDPFYTGHWIFAIDSESNSLVGYMAVCLDDDSDATKLNKWFVMDTVVIPSFRRNKIGTSMFQKCWLDAGQPAVEAATESPAARDFWKSLGFVVQTGAGNLRVPPVTTGSRSNAH
jgi:GNAT superfamily N-acetyltransferase